MRILAMKRDMARRTIFSISYLVIILFFFGCNSDSTEHAVEALSIIPKPVSLKSGKGVFYINSETKIVLTDHRATEVASYLSDLISVASAFTVPVALTKEIPEREAIVLDLKDSLAGSTTYELQIDDQRIVISSHSTQGLFYGVQTLRQLLPASLERKDKQTQSWKVPHVTIEDEARYSWRGMHLDVSRHFFSVDFVKQFIDRLALYKFNRLHLHLTDDQGWRLQIKKYPELTDKGAWRVLNNQDSVCLDKARSNPDFSLPEEFLKEEDGLKLYGGFYTQDDIKEIVKYASERFITIVPEIDMPGHMNAAITSFPDLTCIDAGGWGKLFSVPLCPCEETTYTFINNVISEVAAMFPGEYIHIGADEVDESSWLKSPACKKLMKQQKMETTKQLHSYFVNRVHEIVKSAGKNTIGWDEITDGIVDTAITVMYWRGWVPDAPIRATSRGHRLIMSPTSHCYFDYEPDQTTLQKMYSFDPVPADFTGGDPKKIIGLQANIWTEYIPTPARLDYMTMPRMTALAEVGWNPGDDWTDFNARVTAHFTRWDEMKIKFRLPDLANIKEQVVFIETGKLDLTIPKGIDEVRYTMDESEPTEQSTLYDKPMSIDSSTNVKILTLGNGKRHGNRYTVKFEKQGYAPATVVADVKPGLTCKYFEGEYNSVNKINERDLKHTAIVDSIAIAPFCRASVFALEFTGFIDIPQEGIYTFYLSSDDGSTLTIGEREVVSNDGFHGDIEKSGQIALSKGLHPFVLKYFDGGGGNTVSLNFDGPSLARQKIPAAFFKTK